MVEAEKQEFWKWTESNWVNPDVDWEKAKFITLGVDVGSVSSQAVIMADEEIYAYSNMRTGSDSPDSARNALNFALEKTSMKEGRIDYCIGTGYGRVNVPFANRSITEIACHARGANFIYASGALTRGAEEWSHRSSSLAGFGLKTGTVTMLLTSKPWAMVRGVTGLVGRPCGTSCGTWWWGW